MRAMCWAWCILSISAHICSRCPPGYIQSFPCQSATTQPQLPMALFLPNTLLACNSVQLRPLLKNLWCISLPRTCLVCLWQPKHPQEMTSTAQLYTALRTTLPIFTLNLWASYDLPWWTSSRPGTVLAPKRGQKTVPRSCPPLPDMD